MTGYRESLRRDRLRAREREAMYAEIRRVYGEGRDGEELLAAAAARRASAERAADPLGLGTPHSKAERRQRRQAGERRAALGRGGDMVARLSRGSKATMGRREVRAARELEALFERAAGGDVVRAIDPSRVQVDGGRGWGEPDRLSGTSDAERLLVAVRVEVGRRAFDVLRRMLSEGETMTAIAITYERSEAARRNGGCSGETRAHVSRLLADGLKGAADVLERSRGRGRVT